ncbi:BT1926 family outer membrane beta-barrel protein [Dysgonomonas sp. GY617]|uniref:BT1926 family outer membrane beta-barrel protein n=1 Tax=Dysgonomonas sp. GY617 TaxID=2780420 RepID=UPI001883BE7C|nr:BT1926 family outer membrane beta-barrel protein [Dysgonomonas sp. GY617]MBF0576085.1 hypothetical protein [Dysgonomonas sp. GY617]
MKKIFSSIVFLFIGFGSVLSAQEDVASYAPEKGDVMLSVNFGVGSYIGMSAPKPNLSEYTLSAPMSAWFDKKPILDIEAKLFVSDDWALKLTGGFTYSNNPGYSEVVGTGGTEPSSIPTYKAVPNSDNIQYAIGLGADRYYASRSDRLFIRFGGEVGFAYGKVTAKADSQEYMGASIAEAYGFRIAPVCGFDYFFDKLLFVGVDVRPVAYQYTVYKERPQAGLGNLSSDNHTFSFISQPMIKLGIKF